MQNSKINTEIEILYYDIDKEKVRETLHFLGAELVYAEFLQKRSVFDFGQNENGEYHWARVRQEKDKVVMSYKKTKKDEFAFEKEVTVSNYEDAVEILKLSGLKETSYQENKREKYNYKNCEVVIDSWPQLEPVVEIEGDTEDEVIGIAKELNIDTDKHFKGSINNVYKLKYGKYIDECEKVNGVVRLDFVGSLF
jgi:adenylate cyclase class 2